VIGRGRAGLGMYPFPELRGAYDAYWSAVASRVDWLPAKLEWDAELHASWWDPDMVVGYTCGWPLVTELRDAVRVVGTFSFAVEGAHGHSYRSVIVARRDAPLTDFVDAVAAVNNVDSLSGWVSLLVAVHGPGASWSGAVRWTGAHVDSARAVHDGAADIASIDAVSWAHIGRFHPELVEGMHVVGAGPLVPCLPVIANAAMSDVQLAELRVALADAITDPAASAARSELQITGFTPLDLDEYLPLLALAPAASE
jgi:ABC-type phosphate/phosphonate transport system substrate-binding protein